METRYSIGEIEKSNTVRLPMKFRKKSSNMSSHQKRLKFSEKSHLGGKHEFGPAGGSRVFEKNVITMLKYVLSLKGRTRLLLHGSDTPNGTPLPNADINGITMDQLTAHVVLWLSVHVSAEQGV